MAFNVLAHNRDDHVKNFAFIVDGNDGWKLSPAFDLTFSTGMGGEHTTSVSGQGHPALENLLKVGAKFHMANAVQIVGEVRYAVAQWAALAKKWKVTDTSTATIQDALSKVDQQFQKAPMQPYSQPRRK